MFAKLKFVFINLPVSTVTHLKAEIAKHGGDVEYLVNPKINFVIATDAEFSSGSSKIQSAISKNLTIVTPAFIDACLKADQLVDHMPFICKVSAAKSSTAATNKNTAEDKMIIDEELSHSGEKENGGANNAATKKAKKEHTKESLGKWRTARVFISSTFRDMHGERDYLTRAVFPELQERCNRLRVHVHPVDLRWGVTEDDVAVEVCLGEVESCAPFFVGVVGSRWGFVPDINADSLAKWPWIRDLRPKPSVTCLEIHAGALNKLHNTRSVIALRDNGFMPDVPPGYRSDFASETPAAAQELEILKDDIRNAAAEADPKRFAVLDNYHSSWKGVVDNKPLVGDLEKFGDFILENLWVFMQEEFASEQMDLDPLSVERSYHESFIESHSRLFVGRDTLMNQIKDYCAPSNTAQNKAMVIVGEPGAGKTSLVSSFALQMKASPEASSGECFVLPHFIGAAPGSTNIRNTLSRVVQELAVKYDFDDPIPQDYNELVIIFRKLLEKAGNPKHPRLILIFDALNQLDDAYHAHTLEWLPELFPARVHTVVSTLKGDVYDNISRRERTELLVGELTKVEQEEIVRTTLWEYRKKLSPDQMTLLLQKKDAYKPLYLIVACEELRVFGVFEKLKERITQMAQTVPTLFDEVLQRLETDHGQDLVKRTMAFLAASRGGLLENEMLALLGEDPRTPLPQTTWSKLNRSLQSYLRPPGESGEGVLDFFHQQLPKAVKRRYFASNDGADFTHKIHERLAIYFKMKADPEDDNSFSAGHRRGLSYLPYHLTVAEGWTKLRDTLCNLAFIESKCEMAMTYDLVTDYFFAISKKDAMPEKIFNEIDEWRAFVQQRTHVLSRYADLTYSLAASMPNTSAPCKQAAFRYESLLETRPWFKWINKPQTPNPCVMTITVSEKVVLSCDRTPARDGRKPIIVTGAEDSLVKTFDAVTGEELRTLKGHKNDVTGVRFSPDGKYIVSGSLDRTIRIWETDSGKELSVIKGAKAWVLGVDWSRDGAYIAGTGQDKITRVYDVSNPAFPTLVATLQGTHQKTIKGVVFSPTNSDQLATFGEDLFISIWSHSAGVVVKSFEGHQKPVFSLAFNNTGTMMASGSGDRLVKLWDLTTGTEVATLAAHKDCACSVGFSPDGSRLVSSSNDNTIILWDTKTAKLLSVLIGHTGTVYKSLFDETGKTITTCSYDRSVKVWTSSDYVEIVGHEARLLAVHFRKDGKFVATGSRDKSIKIWDTATGKELTQLDGHQSNVFCIRWSPDGNFLCSASRDHTLRVWTGFNSGQVTCFKVLEGHTGNVNGCDWSPDGRFILSCSDDKTLRLWDMTKDFQSVGILYGHRAPITACAFNHRGTRAASCGLDKTVKLWDTRLGKQNYGQPFFKVATFCGHKRTINKLVFSPDDKTLISGGEDRLLIEWDANTAKQLATMVKHNEEVTDIDFTPDGRYLMSVSTDSSFILWDAKTKKIVCMFAGMARLCCVSACADNKTVAIGDGSGGLYLLKPVGVS
jgi:telomerase protein component 1